MSATQNEIVLVTPVWNDSARLGIFGADLASVLSEANLPVRWIVSDDGSSEAELKQLERLVGQFKELYPAVELLRGARSRKGGAVYRAWDGCPDAAWVAFVDADGAISAAETLQLLHLATLGDAGAVIGARFGSEEAPVRRSLFRSLISRSFSYVVRLLTGVAYADTQCGVKVISGASYRSLAGAICESGYVFDVELLLLLKLSGVRVEQMPVSWLEMPNSKLKMYYDVWPMLAALWRIRRRWKSGSYASHLV